MPSILSHPNGRKGVEFYVDADRYRVRIGKASLKTAQEFVTQLDRLITAKRLARPDREAARWAEALSPKVNAALVKAGLVKPPVKRTLAGIFAGHATTLKVKESTRTRIKQTEAGLVEHFGKDRDPAEINPMDAQAWREAMEKEYAEATISKRVKDARRVFAWAVKMELIDANPFANVRAGDESNAARNFFVTREMTAAILDACPNAEWRLIVALARYAGLRCPSELWGLRWADVLWDRRKFRVSEGKTAERWCKLFPELEPYLTAALAEAKEGAEHVIGNRSRSNLRTRLYKIIRRAGLTPWPRVFQNLRASRETELVEEYPIHVACAWIGNSERVARKHYLMVPDFYYEDRGGKTGELRGAESKLAEAQMSKNRTDAAKTASGSDKAPHRQPQQGVNPPGRLRGKEGRPDQNGGIPGWLETLPDEARMRRARAAVDAAWAELNGTPAAAAALASAGAAAGRARGGQQT